MQKDCNQVWQNCLDFIKDILPDKHIFETWFVPLKPLALQDGALTLKVPSMFFCEWLEANYIGELRAAIKKELGDGGKLI